MIGDGHGSGLVTLNFCAYLRACYRHMPPLLRPHPEVAIVARTMAENRIGPAIVTKNDKLVGIFTVTDACRALAEVLARPGELPDDVA